MIYGYEWSTKRGAKFFLKPVFQPQSLYETFQLFSEDACSEDLATYQIIENAYAYFRHGAILFSYVTSASMGVATRRTGEGRVLPVQNSGPPEIAIFK